MSNAHNYCPARTMLLLKTTPLLTVSVIWSFMVAYSSSASLPHLKASSASTWSDHKESTRASIRNHPEHFVRKPLSQIGPLDKRGNDLSLSLVSFEPLGFIVPVQAAARALEAFYTSIAINANGPWTSNTPRIWIKMTRGTIVLLMSATEGTTIPWDFVSWFALQMLRYTECGYTGTYTANYANPTMGNAIWVSLYHCAIEPLTNPAAIGAPATIASCLNANAQAWFPPTRGTRAR